MQYRADIDGLRAVAVMAVILAHAGAPFVEGGFLGVDVFFAISGYLIATIIGAELERGGFSLGRFYERRARRIVPALIPVIAVSTPLAMWLMLPDGLENYGQSVVATLLFANNLLLAATAGYWEIGSSYKPLLHTWSLGVEEQFYLVFPLLLAMVWRFGRRGRILLVAGLGLTSLALAEFGWRTSPDAAFYLPFNRAWELMAGCAAVHAVPAAARCPRALAQAVSLGSLAALVLPMILFREGYPITLAWQALPVLGAVGVILFSRPGMAVHRLLSLRPVVFIGLISYSAYLWHQPLFAFARIASLQPPGPWQMAGLVVLTLALGALSWRHVEQPFRRVDRVPLRRFAPIAASAGAALIAIGLVFHFGQGFPRWTFPAMVNPPGDWAAYNRRVMDYDRPAFPRNGRPNVLVVGDSFARDAANVLIEAGALDGKNLAYAEDPLACPRPDAGTGRRAALYRDASVIVVALRWHSPDCVSRIEQRLQAFRDVPVVYVGTKYFAFNINPFARVPLSRRATTHAAVIPELARTNAAVRAMLGPERFIDFTSLLGGDGAHPRMFDDRGNLLTPDGGHLTRDGAIFAAKALRRQAPPALRLIVQAAPSGLPAKQPLGAQPARR